MNQNQQDDIQEQEAMAKVDSCAKVVTVAVNGIQQLLSIYHDFSKLDTEHEIAMSQLMATALKCQTLEKMISVIYTERKEALSQQYSALNEGIKQNNQTIILESMRQIGNIVTSKPLESLEEFWRNWEQPEANPLDF